MGDLTTNFSRREFACHDGTPWPDEHEDALQRLVKACQRIRDEWGGPLVVVSAYRPLRYNRSVGSKDTSQHTEPSDAKSTPPCAVDLKPMDRLGAHREARSRLLHDVVLPDVIAERLAAGPFVVGVERGVGPIRVGHLCPVQADRDQQVGHQADLHPRQALRLPQGLQVEAVEVRDHVVDLHGGDPALLDGVAQDLSHRRGAAKGPQVLRIPLPVHVRAAVVGVDAQDQPRQLYLADAGGGYAAGLQVAFHRVLSLGLWERALFNDEQADPQVLPVAAVVVSLAHPRGASTPVRIVRFPPQRLVVRLRQDDGKAPLREGLAVALQGEDVGRALRPPFLCHCRNVLCEPHNLADGRSPAGPEQAIELVEPALKEGAQSPAAKEHVKRRFLELQGAAVSDLKPGQMLHLASGGLVSRPADKALAGVHPGEAATVLFGQIQLQFPRAAGDAQ